MKNTIPDYAYEAKRLYKMLETALSACDNTIFNVHDEVISSSPLFDKYTEAQDNMFTAKREGNICDLIQAHEKFHEIEKKVIDASPTGEDYKHLCYTRNMLSRAVNGIKECAKSLEALDKQSQSWSYTTEDGID